MDNYFVFEKSAKEVLFAVNPELVHHSEVSSYYQIEGNSQSDKVRVSCTSTSCNSHVGTKMNIGPRNTPLISFGKEKVRVCGESALDYTPPNWKTFSQQPIFLNISRRNCSNVFGQSESCKAEAAKASSAPPILPHFGDQDVIRWDDLVSEDCEKKPRKEQLIGFRRALFSNLIVCIPTGKGKTFISALLMARMKKLNPLKLVVMIVERIPLVFQQASAVSSDTKLYLSSFCSETTTQATIQKLLDGTVDGLVATAGALFNLLNQKKLLIEHFSVMVFDECHHSTGDHMYCRILDLVKETAVKQRPRLLGLSASPVNALLNVEDIRKKIDKLLEKYGNAKVYKPMYEVEDAGIEWRTVQLSTEQLQEQDKICRKLQPLLEELFSAVGVRKVELTDISDTDQWSCKHDILF